MKPLFIRLIIPLLIFGVISCRRPPHNASPASNQALRPSEEPPTEIQSSPADPAPAQPASPETAQPPAASSPAEAPSAQLPAASSPAEAPSAQNPAASSVPAQPPSAASSLSAQPPAEPPALTQTAALPAFHIIDGVGWSAQTWNNCGPANLAIVMNFWGSDTDQAAIKAVIRPHDKDPHAAVSDLIAFARESGLNAAVYWNSTLEDLKAQVAANRPVMAPAWHIDSDGQEMGHYRTVYGYDDERRIVFIRDTLDGPNYALTYSDFDFLWGVYNRPLMLITAQATPGAGPPAPASSAVPSAAAPAAALEATLETTLEATSKITPEQLNISPSRAEALTLFAEGMALSDKNQHIEAAAVFDRADAMGLPWRIWWYFPRGLASYAEAGMNERLLAVVRAALTPYPYSEELHYWAARAQDMAGDIEGAAASLAVSLSLKPGWLKPRYVQALSPALRARMPQLAGSPAPSSNQAGL